MMLMAMMTKAAITCMTRSVTRLAIRASKPCAVAPVLMCKQRFYLWAVLTGCCRHLAGRHPARGSGVNAGAFNITGCYRSVASRQRGWLDGHTPKPLPGCDNPCYVLRPDTPVSMAAFILNAAIA